MATERAVFLWSASQRALKDGSPALSRVLLLGMDKVCADEGTPLPTRASQRVCASCFSLLVPGVSCHVDQLAKHPRRPLARRRSLRLKCTHCGHSSSFPTPTPPSARAAIADVSVPAPAAAPSKPPSKRSAHADAAGSGKARKRPALRPAAPAEPQSSDALFGFDFVPL